MLTAKEIRKSYRRKDVLKGVSFTVKPGECIGIVGANGCGKTTLLSILAGAQRADGGSLSVDGAEALGNPKLLSAKVAYVPQENPLIPELSAKDTLSLWYQGSREGLHRELDQGPAAFLGVDSMLSMSAGDHFLGTQKGLVLHCRVFSDGPPLDFVV